MFNLNMKTWFRENQQDQSWLPPINTPDVCHLESKPYHFVFDYTDKVRQVLNTKPWLKRVFSDQKVVMWQQVPHKDGTQLPTLTFRKAISDARHCQKAKLKGNVHVLSSEDLVLLDKEFENGVRSERHLIRVQTQLPKGVVRDVPYYAGLLKEFRELGVDLDKAIDRALKSSSRISPQNHIRIFQVWIYFDSPKVWKEHFDFDYSLTKGREGTAFVPARAMLDPNPTISWFYAFSSFLEGTNRTGPSLWAKPHQYKNFLAALKYEDNSAIVKSLNGPIPGDETRKFIYLNDIGEDIDADADVFKAMDLDDADRQRFKVNRK